jgi:hypothetical protein
VEKVCRPHITHATCGPVVQSQKDDALVSFILSPVCVLNRTAGAIETQHMCEQV